MRQAALFPIFVAVLAVCLGCQTSTIESRRSEREAAYQQLSPEQKSMVDQGQIKVGMSEDAVYIAWGKPAQVLHRETGQGATTTWLYHGHHLQSRHYWGYREYKDHQGRLLLSRSLETDYYPQDYLRAEIIFAEGKVKEWRTLSRPLDKVAPRY